MADDDLTKKTNVTSLSSVRLTPQQLVDKHFVSIAVLFGSDIPEPEFFIPGAIPRASIIMIVGPSGLGKSWVAYDLARAIATGTSWMARGPAARQGRVLIINYDNPSSVLKQRLMKLGLDAQAPITVHTHGLPAGAATIMLTMPRSANVLKDAITEIKPDCIIVDSLRQAHTMDENSAEDMANLMRILKTFTATGASVVVLHHSGKGMHSESWSADARGSGEIVASSDVVIELAAGDARVGINGKGRLTWKKHRAWDIGPVTHCDFDIKDEDAETTIITALSELPGESAFGAADSILRALANAHGHPLARRELAVATRLVRTVIGTALTELLRRGRIVEVPRQREDSAVRYALGPTESNR